MVRPTIFRRATTAITEHYESAVHDIAPTDDPSRGDSLDDRTFDGDVDGLAGERLESAPTRVCATDRLPSSELAVWIRRG